MRFLSGVKVVWVDLMVNFGGAGVVYNRPSHHLHALYLIPTFCSNLVESNLLVFQIFDFISEPA